jgi:hypothetical protein
VHRNLPLTFCEIFKRNAPKAAGKSLGNSSSRHLGYDATMKEHYASGSTVFVIDDDASVRAALKELFQSVGLHVELFASGSAFLENRLPTATSGCLVMCGCPE